MTFANIFAPNFSMESADLGRADLKKNLVPYDGHILQILLH